MLLLGVAACGGEDATGSSDKASLDMGDEIAGVEVTGEVGAEPKVAVDAPLKVDETTWQVITVGGGDEAVVGEDALLHLHIVDGTTGQKASSTYDQGKPMQTTLSKDQFMPALVDAIAGKPVGSRVAVAASPEDVFGPADSQQPEPSVSGVVLVADVISAKPADVLDAPSGKEAEDVAGLPTIEESDGTITGLSFAEAPGEPAPGLKVTTLVEGEGQPIRDDSLVTMDYVGQVYGAEEPFNNSFAQEPATFAVGVGGLIPGWDSELVGVKSGSRVLLSIPPEEGYGSEGNPSINVKGDDTLVFLIDVLGVG